jgi:pilus assembly protein CpaF
VNIRKFVLSVPNFDELVQLGTVPSEVARFLEASVAAGLNIIVAGERKPGIPQTLNTASID